MRIELADLTDLTDTEVKRMAIAADQLAGEGGRASSFWRTLSLALVRAQRGRRAAADDIEDLVDCDVVGALVGPDDDPVGDALAALRRGPYEAGVGQ